MTDLSDAIATAPDRVLSTADLCRLLGGICRMTLWRRVKAGKVPAGRRIGRAVVWVLDDVRHLVVS